jgi:carbonic anhydrase
MAGGVSRRAVLAMGVAAAAAPGRPADRDPKAVFKLMVEGNRRFAAGKPQTPRRTPADFLPLAEGQKPLAAVVSCADSRVTPELLFDLGIGELFVIRVAGNLTTGTGAAIKGSLEYAVAELGVRLVMVLGHSGCGAMKAAIKHVDDPDPLPGALGDLVDLIKPAVNAAQHMPGDLLTNVIRANVVWGGRRLRGLATFADADKTAKVLVVGGVYQLGTGLVETFDV